MAKFVEVVKRDTGEVTAFVDITDESKDFISALYDLIERDVDHESFFVREAYRA
jgi:hypothetical protein